MKFCRKDLPSTFRITKIRGHAKDLLKSLKDGYIAKLATEDIKSITESAEGQNDVSEESEQDLFLEPIPWYPEDLAWNNNLSRRIIRRSEFLRKLHRFLVEDSECGAITRQEAVSMIPPMLLDVQSHHLVLDMCAAPGSKTAQIIEMMHSDCKESHVPTGAVVANDADHKRCYMLTHQSKRLNTPCVIITNHDASAFPKLHIDSSKKDLLKFDRVLCDVPCSGDGTVRKNPLLWHKWTPHLGNALHRLQMRILIRGLELLEVGGRLVYSTCSFNPIENEAVIATVLKESNGSVNLVDCSNNIPLLKRRPGMTDWFVFDRRGKQVERSEVNVSNPTEGIKESMFPPTKEVLQQIHIERCMRIYPHLQNTGGFFIAVLEKTSELPWQKTKRIGKSLPWEDINASKAVVEPEEEPLKKDNFNVENQQKQENQISEKSASPPPAKKACIQQDDDNEESAQSQSNVTPLKIRRGIMKEDPYIFLDDNDKDLKDVRDFYGLSNELPSKHFLVRSSTAKKRHIYLVSEAVNKIMTINKNLKVINTGVKVVTRSPFRAGKEEHGIEYRLVQDGLQLIHKCIGNRIIPVTHNDIIMLISQRETRVSDISESTRLSLGDSDMGCVVWHYDVSKVPTDDQPLSSDIWLCGHKGRVMVQVMLNKEERKHYLRILGQSIPDELQTDTKGASWGDRPNPDDSKLEVKTENDEDEIEEQ